MKKLYYLAFILVYGSTASAQFQPSFKSLRYDENYSFLNTDTANNWYEKMKFSPLNSTGSAYISLGGEIRYQYFNIQNEDWGDAPKDKNGYVLNRFLAHADFHATNYFRAFIQLQGATTNGKPTTSPIDENILDLHQAFFDVSFNLPQNSQLVFRTGRQEMQYGTQRLTAVREAPNNRQAFDAIKVIFLHENFRSDAFFSDYVIARKDIFDDKFTNDIQFWGVYNVFNNVPVFSNVDVYYLGIRKKIARFDDGIGRELRHSIGSRIWNTKGSWQYDLEGLYQFGSLATQNISAWTLSANIAYQFQATKLNPTIGLKVDAISGNKEYDDNRLQTFNPLFPKGAYFGLAALIGPSNLFDIHPSINLELNDRLEFNADYDIFWRWSRNDGIYANNVALIYSGRGVSDKFIGSQIGANLDYQANPFILFRVESTWFNTGAYLKAVSVGKDIFFVGTTATLRF